MRSRIYIIVCFALLSACSKKSDIPKALVKPALPGQAALTFPAQNAVCVTGTILSDTVSAVTFTWSAATHTDNYNLVLKNLLTAQVSTQNTKLTQLTINLSRNTPYSWFITSQSTSIDSTAQSDTWRFYNAGPGIVTYAPFPAEITSPAYGDLVTATGGVVSLAWQGSSVNPGTIVSYQVYFGTSNPPPLFGSTADPVLKNVPVSSGKTYYWKVITTDIEGNTSDSGIYQFTVN